MHFMMSRIEFSEKLNQRIRNKNFHPGKLFHSLFFHIVFPSTEVFTYKKCLSLLYVCIKSRAFFREISFMFILSPVPTRSQKARLFVNDLIT